MKAAGPLPKAEKKEIEQETEKKKIMQTKYRNVTFKQLLRGRGGGNKGRGFYNSWSHFTCKVQYIQLIMTFIRF